MTYPYKSEFGFGDKVTIDDGAVVGQGLEDITDELHHQDNSQGTS